MKRTNKELFILLLTFSIVLSSFAGAFFAVPYQVYAADEWEDVSQDDLVTAFRYYCKSRNLTIDGSVADALTSFTTTTFNNICNTLGIDVTSLQADLKKTVEGNLGLRFLMNQQGVLAYNRIFAEFLQNNDLEVGDSVDNKNLYSGYVYDGHLVFIVNNIRSYNYSLSNVVMSGSYISDITSQIQSFFNTNWPDGWNSGGTNYYTVSYPDGYSYSASLGITGTVNYVNDNFKIFRNMERALFAGSSFYLGYKGISSTHTVYYMLNGDSSHRIYYGLYFTNSLVPDYYSQTTISNNNVSPGDYDSEPADVYITSNNNTINNNEYNNNYTIIYNDGDTYITDDDDEPSPDTQPGGGGGGGGGDDPTDPDVPSYDPYPGGGGPSTPGTTTTGSDGVFKLPDIGFDFPDIDWSLKNIGDKFPFCIPGDIVSVLTLLNADPEAPKIQATVPIPHVYNWEIDIDFSDYDRYALIVRTVEFLGFVISLIYLTIRMVKG